METDNIGAGANSTPKVTTRSVWLTLPVKMDSRDKSHESSITDTLFGRESVFALDEEDQQVTASTGDTADDVHAVQEGGRVLDDTEQVRYHHHQ